MDETGRRIVDIVGRAFADPLPARAREAARRHLLDSLGCTLGGLSSPPALIARDLARRVAATRPARVFAGGFATSPEMAAFANTVALRYLDFNDTYISKSGLHPSDAIPALVALAECHGATGAALIAAIVAAYDVLGAIADATDIRERGWDQGILISIAVAAAGTRLAGGDDPVVGHAASIAAVSDVPTRQTRVGELSMWKGCATAAAARNGVFAAELALAGMTAPPAPFDGYHGLGELVTGPLDLRVPTEPGTALARTSLKFHPSEYHSQAPLDLLARIRPGLDVDAIESIRIASYWVVVDEIAEPAKWAPASRETADHSLPYLVATMLVHGDVWVDSYGPDRLADGRVRALMAKIRIEERAEFTAAYPGELLTEFEFTFRDAPRRIERVAAPRGHPGNPMSWNDVERKFDRLARSGPGEQRGAAIRDAIDALERGTVGELVDTLAPAR